MAEPPCTSGPDELMSGGTSDDRRDDGEATSIDRSVWLRIATMGLALAFLVGAFGYFVGVRTNGVPSNEVDVGFLDDMADHHDQAIAMSLYELAHGTDPVVTGFASEVLLFQRRELGLFEAYQDERGVSRADYDPDRMTMVWMDMPRRLADMTGMATDAQLAELYAAKGIDADKLFLKLMQTHHIGGAHMGDFAAQHAADPKIRVLADRMATMQRIEAREYQQTIDRLEAG